MLINRKGLVHDLLESINSNIKFEHREDSEHIIEFVTEDISKFVISIADKIEKEFE